MTRRTRRSVAAFILALVALWMGVMLFIDTFNGSAPIGVVVQNETSGRIALMVLPDTARSWADPDTRAVLDIGVSYASEDYWQHVFLMEPAPKTLVDDLPIVLEGERGEVLWSGDLGNHPEFWDGYSPMWGLVLRETGNGYAVTPLPGSR